MSRADKGGETLPASDEAAPGASPERELLVVDPRCYEMGEEVARGGWGRILRAYDRRLGRTVAIKQLRVASHDVEERLRREARLTARLEHPAIVPVHEVGRWPSGESFYAMKLVEGRSLQELLDLKPSLGERLPLLPHVLAVADAIAYAHSRGVIHRDLKPSNIMVGSFGETLVIDWGLAKEVGDRAGDVGSPGRGSPELTMAGSVVGTPSYLAPEQARGEPVDERADIYALGSMLYTLVAGQAPYPGDNAEEILSRVRTGPARPVAHVAPGTPTDLMAIVDKAMARDPGARYGSALELAEDLRRFLAGRLVGAQRYSMRELVTRWLRAHWRGVAAAGLAGALALTGLRLRQEQAVAEARQAELTFARARDELERDPTLSAALLKRYAPIAGADGARLDRLAAEAESRTVARQVLFGMDKASFSTDSRRVIGLRGEHVRIFDLRTGAVRELENPDSWMTHLRVSPDGAHFATVDSASGLLVWSLAAGEASRRVLKGGAGLIWLDWSGDGRYLVTTDNNGDLYRVDTRTGEVLRRSGRGDAQLAFFAPSGTDIAVTGSDGVRLFRGDAPEPLVLPPPGPFQQLAFSPDGAWLVWGTKDGEVRAYEVASGALRVVGRHAAPVVRQLFMPDGRALVTLGNDGSLRLWGFPEGPGRELAPPGGDPAFRLAVSSGGAYVATAGEKGNVELHDVASGAVTRLSGHRHAITRIQFSPDDAWLLSSDSGGQTRIWPVAPPPGTPIAARGPDAAVAGAGGLVAVHGRGAIEVRDLVSGAARSIALPAAAGPGLVVAAGGTVAAVGAGAAVVLVDLRSGAVRSLASPVAVRALALSAEGARVAVSGIDDAIWVLDAGGGAPAQVSLHSATTIDFLRFSPDGRTVLFSTRTSGLGVWTPGGPPPTRIFAAAFATDACFAPDGQTVAMGLVTGRANVWRVEDPRTRTLSAHEARVNRLAFSPDGRRLASAADDGAVWLKDVASGEGRRLSHPAAVSVVVFLDDHRLASAGADGAVRFWNADSGVEQAVERVGHGRLDDLFLSGGVLVAVDGDRVLRVRVPSATHAALAALTSAELVDGVLVTPGAEAPP